MFKKKNIVELFRAEIGQHGEHRGRALAVNRIRREVLGITESEGGSPTIAKGSARAEEFSLRTLAEAIGGHEFVENYMQPGEGPDLQSVLEAGPGIDPTAFINISTFSAAVGGLIEAKVIEKFTEATRIGDQLVTTEPTKLNGQKKIGVTAVPGKDGHVRKPGMPHARTGIGEEWAKTPELEEKALAIEVTQEAVFYDLTGEVLDQAGGVGNVLGYGKEVSILDMVLGVTNTYNYKDNAYNTYLTSGAWINDQVNPLVDYKDIDDMLALVENMTDPATGREIIIEVKQILHMPRNRMNFHNVLRSTEIRNTTNANTVTIAPNPVDMQFGLLESQIAYNRALAADGLNLSTADAKGLWIAGDFKGAFSFMEAWPLRVRQANAAEFVMLDRGLIAAFFANHRGIPAVIQPRKVVRNKNA